MKKLILAILFLSSCDQIMPQSKPTDPPPIICAISAPQQAADLPALYYYYSISSELDRSKLDSQLKITLNDEVVLDTCAAQSIEGFTVYPYYGALTFNLDLRQNNQWFQMYIDETGKPLKHDIDLKIETRATCDLAWREAVPQTNTALSWYETGGGCTAPGYNGSFSVPLGN